MDKSPINAKNLSYCLIDIYILQPGRAKDCADIITNLEQRYKDINTDRKYYDRLVNILFFTLGRDGEDVNSTISDFILARLINEPLYYSKDQVFLELLLARLQSMYPSVYKALRSYIDTFIQKKNINSLIAPLVSTQSSDDERIQAFLKIIRENCYHSVQLCRIQSNNAKMLDRACDIILEQGDWKSLSADMLYTFVRDIVYVDQRKANNFISELYELNKNKNLPVSNPIGLLCFRHAKRQELLQSISKLPAANKDKLNIAVCISGQLRGYKGNLKNLVDNFGLDQHNFRVFIHTWKNVGRYFPTRKRASRVFGGEFLKAYNNISVNKPEPELKEHIKTQYRNFYSLLISSSEASFDVLQEEYKTSDIVIDDEDDGHFSNWTNQEKMHYKIFAAHKLALDSQENFDLIIRIRPDIRYACKSRVDILDLLNKSRSNGSIFTTDGLFSFGFTEDFAIHDAFAIGIPQAMGVYANTYPNFKWHLKNNTYSFTKEFKGHVSLEHNLFCYGVGVDKIPQRLIGSLKDPEGISIEDIYAALSGDIGSGRQTSEAKYLLDACKKDITAS